MHITLISFDNWGLNKHIATDLQKQGHTVQHIDFNTFKYKYPSVLHKAYNVILKAFFKTNLKHQHYGKEIIKELKKNDQIQDVILTIKGDFITPKSILEFKKYTKKSIGFFNDNIYRCPKIKRVLHCFDEVFSFEKEDCEKFNLNFASNWIYNSENTFNRNEFEYDVFNISSIDKRLPILKRIANNLASQKIKFKFIVYDKKQKDDDKNIQYIQKHMPLTEVNDYISHSKVLLDINRIGQAGLTFRVFESIGLNKKLITTNSDIKNYDFYNPNNILIIDEINPVIPTAFFENEYEKIPHSIYQKYTLEGWCNNVIFSV
ncbi:hypothetical protein [Flavobacterium quisquiliarum]|uniref:Uncharacterized protein n=1 Tax=Flavobacterium quisquiliarum TaxID=1834436 RepID=A0ABV8W944_9FLAO|nr:hypothetical protein [Flavobacterium quisquiliarum]MBW1656281.1 hypothetical protein [Flavobacterium quisquiliarum]NWL02124.1 hypothetical protein [Flavobacterium collinsii]